MEFSRVLATRIIRYLRHMSSSNIFPVFLFTHFYLLTYLFIYLSFLIIGARLCFIQILHKHGLVSYAKKKKKMELINIFNCLQPFIFLLVFFFFHKGYLCILYFMHCFFMHCFFMLFHPKQPFNFSLVISASLFFYHVLFSPLLLFLLRGCPRGVMVKTMDCGIVVHEFVLQSRNYVHFRANTLILPAIG